MIDPMPDPDERAADPVDLDPEDAFGHPVLREPPADDDPWADGDEDDVDV